ncbi:MAG: hypothetical protein K0S97_1869, partial [Chloroflexota bacterium]|nr:hypothetical protein [Chloroflexota bacterium]
RAATDAGVALSLLTAGRTVPHMDYEERQRRLDRAWVAIRFELFIGFLAPAVVAFLFIAMPNYSGPTFAPVPAWFSLVMAAPVFIGGAGVVFGLVWLVRFSRPDPERDQGHWRYRDF